MLFKAFLVKLGDMTALPVDLGILFSTFLLIFLSEIGDKSQLVALSLSSRGHHPAALFLGSASALVFSSVLAALAGRTAASFLPGILPWLSGGIFLAVGLFVLFHRDKPDLEECLLQGATLERALADRLPSLLEEDPRIPPVMKQVAEEEKRHSDQFNILLLGKELNRIINYPPEPVSREIQQLHDAEKTKDSGFLQRDNLRENLKEILRIERALYQLYHYLMEELTDKKGWESARRYLRKSLQEEDHHLALFTQLTAELSQEETSYAE